MVVRPPAFDGHGDLVFAGSLEGPVIVRGNELDHIDRVGLALGFHFQKAHASP